METTRHHLVEECVGGLKPLVSIDVKRQTCRKMKEGLGNRDAEAMDFSAAFSSALPLSLPPKRSYFINAYLVHKCGSGWPR